jgi:hypothetical protein
MPSVRTLALRYAELVGHLGPGDCMTLDTGRETIQFAHLDPGVTANLGVW